MRLCSSQRGPKSNLISGQRGPKELQKNQTREAQTSNLNEVNFAQQCLFCPTKEYELDLIRCHDSEPLVLLSLAESGHMETKIFSFFHRWRRRRRLDGLSEKLLISYVWFFLSLSLPTFPHFIHIQTTARIRRRLSRTLAQVLLHFKVFSIAFTFLI